jgi:alkylation response protein AidB-like acyl-CoA dehydrogenase
MLTTVMDARTRSAAPLLERVAQAVAAARDRAAAFDAHPAFPAADVVALHTAGALGAVAPPAHGGLGLGTCPDGAEDLFRLLRLIGAASLALGRLFEAHVNALKLITVYGTPEQIERASADAAAGHLFALWVTETGRGAWLEGGEVRGAKMFCSGAGHVARAVVTARRGADETVLALIELEPGTRVLPDRIRLQGMRAAITGAMDLDGLPADVVGAPGDYLRQPEFSAGAWRTAAVTLGGLDALVDAVRDELTQRRRADSPHQLVRLGALRMAQESAALWVAKAARLAEAADGDPGEVAAYVNLARIAVEQAVLGALATAQRALGLNGFIEGRPAERLMRDLATYLRQPAPDETLTEAAAWFTTHPLPP